MAGAPPTIVMGPAAGGWVMAVGGGSMPPTPDSRRAANHLLDQVLVFCRLRRKIRAVRRDGGQAEARRLAREGQQMEKVAVRNALALLTTEWPAWQPAPEPPGMKWLRPEDGDDGTLSWWQAWAGMPPPEPGPPPPPDETLPLTAGPGSIFSLYLRELGGGR